jgi:MHS family alpha-ketoglutarate permease-like MFS transporter
MRRQRDLRRLGGIRGLWFKQAGHEPNFYWYVSVMCALACIVAIRMPDPTKSGLLK